ncbi:MAG: TonB family protein [Bryobacteraceae bacterium]
MFSLRHLAFFLPAAIGLLAQEAETPHQTLQKAKALGLNDAAIDQAEPLLEHAIAGWQDRDPRNPEYAETLTLLGMMHQHEADLDIQALRTTVEPLYKHALNVYRRSLTDPDPDKLALTLELEAAVLNAIGEVEDATPLSERALAIRKERVREMQAGAPQIPAAFKPGEGVTAPKLINKAEPGPTDAARFLKINGTVSLRFVVDEHGVPQDIALVHSLGYGLDEKAVETLRTWRFQPGTSDNLQVATIATIDMIFSVR